jgi:superfamily II DNA or RNA helicase
MVVGPPGTGKTDTAVQILNVLYHNCPSQRTLIITHSNQALNDLFEKIMQVLSLHSLLSELLLPIMACYCCCAILSGNYSLPFPLVCQ